MTLGRFLRTTVVALAIAGTACSSRTPEEFAGTGGSGPGGSTGGGGKAGSGGMLASGGTTGSGGQKEPGGSTATGGRGGSDTTGGATSSGGQPGPGGSSGLAVESGPGAGGAGTTGDAGLYVGTKTPGTAQTGDITITPATTFQTMDGFGIADVWETKQGSTPALLTLLFDPDQGIGLTLLRIGIESNGKIMGDAAFVDGPEVVKHGGKVWAAPWSPPASSKDNNNVNNGGHLSTSAYDSWSSTLTAFPAYFKQQSGVDLWGISAQNEPDFVANYESCIFDKTQMNNFIKVLGPKLQALTPPVHVIAAEPDTWGNTWGGDNFGTAINADSTVSPLVDIIATHDYDNRTNNSTTRPSPPASNTHHIWETEIYYSDGADIGPGLETARGIYAGVTTGGASGWHYWWTRAFMNGGDASKPPKRVYAMGNFSKFVRPGYVRVGITGAPASVQIVPFVNPTDGTVAIVALNSGSSDVAVSFFVAGAGWPSTVTPYVTSASSNLKPGTTLPSVTGGRFSGSLAAQSVTTFVGKP